MAARVDAAQVQQSMADFRKATTDEDKRTHFLALLVLSGENPVEETTQRLCCLNVQDLSDLFQYHTYLDIDAQDVFSSANQKAQHFFLKNKKKPSDFAEVVQPKQDGSNKGDSPLKSQGFGSIFWITMLGLLILGAGSFFVLRRAGAQKIS